MLIHHRPDWQLAERDATPEGLYLRRRELIAGALAAGLLPGTALAQARGLNAQRTLSLGEELTAESAATSYNNFYEFGLDKDAPARNAGSLRVSPWALKIGGLARRPITLDIDQLVRGRLEERVYRFRCVEGWSMVVPWVGVPLASVIQRAEPLGSAKYVAFQTLNDRAQMPGLRWPVLDWPYVEGLRLDEALHPLTMLVVGMYGKRLPNQNGAPVRLIVPWKYGFKSIKSIVSMRFVAQQPPTAWNKSAPSEYGFYSNVNPAVDHPRWSQATERRLGDFVKRPTLPFNGYAADVAALYRGMDLTRFY